MGQFFSFLDALEGAAFIVWMVSSCTLTQLPAHSSAFLQLPRNLQHPEKQSMGAPLPLESLGQVASLIVPQFPHLQMRFFVGDL